MKKHNRNIDNESKGKLRQFHRLLLSYGDFKQAYYIASYILDNKLHNSEDRRLLEALNCTMIIAYGRPFSGNDRGVDMKIPDLPKSFIRNLPDDEKEIHEVVMIDRNTLLAHSDSSSSGLMP